MIQKTKSTISKNEKVHFNISVKERKNAESAKRKVQFWSPNACRILPRFYRRFIARLIGASRWVCIRVATCAIITGGTLIPHTYHGLAPAKS